MKCGKENILLLYSEKPVCLLSIREAEKQKKENNLII